MSREIERQFTKHPVDNSEDASETDVEVSLLRGHQFQARHRHHAGPSRMKQSLNLVSAVCKIFFYVSATICLWIYLGLIYKNTLTPSPIETGEDRVLYTGFGDGNYGLAEDVSGQIPTCKCLSKCYHWRMSH